MGHRYVELFHATKAEMMAAAAGHDPRSMWKHAPVNTHTHTDTHGHTLTRIRTSHIQGQLTLTGCVCVCVCGCAAAWRAHG